MVIENIALLVEVFAVIWCIHLCYGEKIKCDWKTLALVIIDIVIMNLINYEYLPKWMSSVIYPIIAIYCGFRFGWNIRKIIVNNVLYLILMSILQMLCLSIASIISMLSNTSENGMILMTNIILLLVMVLISRFVEMRKFSDYLCKKEIVPYLIFMFGCIVIFICMYMFKHLGGMYFGEYILLCICLLLLCIVTISWEKYKIKSTDSEAELNAYKLYEESYKNLINEIRIRQHEFNNHINAIYNMSSIYRTYEELVENQKKYCEELESDNRYGQLLKLGNTVVIGFLYGKLLEAERKNINVIYEVRCMMLETGIPMYKLVEILGNLINNAIDALESQEDKKMKIVIIEDSSTLKLIVSNLSDYKQPQEIARMFKRGYSSKGSMRGIGLYSLKRMSTLYRFDLICCNEMYDGRNWITFTININKSASNNVPA